MTPRPVSNIGWNVNDPVEALLTRTDLDALPADWPEVAYAVYPNGASLPEQGVNYAIMQAWSMAPRSIGSVTIQSADMAVPPVIDPNWFSSQTDVEVTIAALKRMRQALNSSAMAPILVGDEVLPGLAVQTDDELASFVAQRGSTIYHAAATNKMGKASDPDAVLDNRGRVIGVQRCKSSWSLPGNTVDNLKAYTDIV